MDYPGGSAELHGAAATCGGGLMSCLCGCEGRSGGVVMNRTSDIHNALYFNLRSVLPLFLQCQKIKYEQDLFQEMGG